MIKTLLTPITPLPILFVSLFGAQNNKRSQLDRIRQVNREVFVIWDECQNLITSQDLLPDSRTVIVFSFNRKNVYGVIGGGVCVRNSALRLQEPPLTCRNDLLLESRVFLILARQSLSGLVNTLRTFSGDAVFSRPALEFSECISIQYDLRVQRIAKLSLVRAILGMATIARTERIRAHNYLEFCRFMERHDFGTLIATERADVSPFVPFELKDRRVFGKMPLKGPYAVEGEPTTSARPSVFLLVNEGLARLKFCDETPAADRH